MFDRVVANEHMRAVFVEDAWNMGNCGPCSASPLSSKELPAQHVCTLGFFCSCELSGKGSYLRDTANLRKLDALPKPDELLRRES